MRVFVNLHTVFFSYKKNIRILQGFTLIELLVVLSIIGIISTFGIASFVSFNRNQVLKQAANELATTLRDAKSRTQSQVKPSVCAAETLRGYSVRICGLAGSACSTPQTYQLVVQCGATTSVLQTKRINPTLNFSPTDTTSVNYGFQVINSGVVGSGSVVLTDANSSATVTVSQIGTVTIQ